MSVSKTQVASVRKFCRLIAVHCDMSTWGMQHDFVDPWGSFDAADRSSGGGKMVFISMSSSPLLAWSSDRNYHARHRRPQENLHHQTPSKEHHYAIMT